jgi:hypothetical protein
MKHNIFKEISQEEKKSLLKRYNELMKRQTKSIDELFNERKDRNKSRVKYVQNYNL